MAAFAIGLRTNQVLTGTAVTGGALGITALLSNVPVIGRALFAQPPITYFVYALVPLTWWYLTKTATGLSLRATGENPAAVRASGPSPGRIQTIAVITGSALGGLGGATLVLAQAGTFAEGMTAGRGFIALAVVALGRWSPFGVAGAALLFGATSSLQHLLQALGTDVPYQVFLALPYLLTLVVLASSGRTGGPAWLGKALPSDM
jgi:simple sugar transport system permease protein